MMPLIKHRSERKDTVEGSVYTVVAATMRHWPS